VTTALEKLVFNVGLVDRVSGPAGKLIGAVNKLARAGQRAAMQVGMGGAAVAGAALAFAGAVGPARDMNKALGEVRSLGVGAGVLDTLGNTALAFSTKYGESAGDFVRSAYDIQSAIAGLSGAELARFTNASNVLAKGTKADAATITDYMGTMYGVFKDKADAMGKAAWVEQLTGQTAAAVQMFKTTGAEMSAAFTAVGANATAAGIDAAEQMAVLGQLQATMSGSEAGAKYKAFLSGVGSAQKALGLSFTDAQGGMLGMAAILDKIRGKFGETLSVGEGDALKKAFGSDEAVSLIKLLLADTSGLQRNIAALGQVKGMEKAEQMAQAMVDPMDRLGAGLTAVRIGFGQALLAALHPLISALADGAAMLARWTKEFPTITKWIGYAVIGVLGFSTAAGLFTASVGAAKLVMVGWQAGMLAVRGVMLTTKAALLVFRFAMLAANAAMWANPALLIVVGVMALIGAVAALIYYWDDLKRAFLDASWGKAILRVFEKIMGWFEKLGGVFSWISEKLGFGGGASGRAATGEDSPVERRTRVSAIHRTRTPAVPQPQAALSAAPEAPEALTAPRKSVAPPGGVARHVVNTMHKTANNQRTMHIEQVTIEHHGDLDAQALHDQLLLGTP